MARWLRTSLDSWVVCCQSTSHTYVLMHAHTHKQTRVHRGFPSGLVIVEAVYGLLEENTIHASTHVHTHKHTSLHKHTHAHIHTIVYTSMRRNTVRYTHAHTHTHARTHTFRHPPPAWSLWRLCMVCWKSIPPLAHSRYGSSSSKEGSWAAV